MAFNSSEWPGSSFERFHADTAIDLFERGPILPRRVLEPIALTDFRRLFVQPHERGFDGVCFLRRVVARGDDIAAAQIDFVRERQGDGFAGFCLVEIAIERDDARDCGFTAGRPNHDGIARPHGSRRNRSGIAAKFLIRTHDALHRKAKRGGPHAAAYRAPFPDARAGFALRTRACCGCVRRCYRQRARLPERNRIRWRGNAPGSFGSPFRCWRNTASS